MVNNVKYPLFEEFGPPCENKQCSGILRNTIEIKTNIFSKQCSKCGEKFHSCSGVEKMDQCLKTFEKLLGVCDALV